METCDYLNSSRYSVAGITLKLKLEKSNEEGSVASFDRPNTC